MDIMQHKIYLQTQSNHMTTIFNEYVAKLLSVIGVEDDELARAKIYGIITMIDTRRQEFIAALLQRSAADSTFEVTYEFGSFSAPLPAIDESMIDELRLVLLEAMFSLHEEYSDYLAQQKTKQCGVSLDFVSRELKPFLYELERPSSSSSSTATTISLNNDNNNSKINVVLEQKLVQNPEDLGNTVWDGAQFLCRQLQLNTSLISGKNVLEVGAGVGLCGIVGIYM